MSKIIQECMRRALMTTELIGAVLPQVASAAVPGVATESMHAAYARLEPELKDSTFGRPIVMRSEEGQGLIRGEVYAVVKYAMGQLNDALATPAHWCDVMILHFNTKYCHVSETADGPMLTVFIGNNTPQELSGTVRLDFKIKAKAPDPENLTLVLTALQGPMGTSNYKITFEAVPLKDGTSFLHLAYSYNVNSVSRMALSVYLSTIARNKVGFTLADNTTTAAPVYIQGMRALVERNTMRYFLAVNAFIESANGPEEARLDARMLNWFTATEAYPLQLKEIELKDYISMKHAEVIRQQDLPPQ